jgi:hypothetical protein
MRYLERQTRKRKRHHEPFVYISPDGGVRVRTLPWRLASPYAY